MHRILSLHYDKKDDYLTLPLRLSLSLINRLEKTKKVKRNWKILKSAVRKNQSSNWDIPCCGLTGFLDRPSAKRWRAVLSGVSDSVRPVHGAQDAEMFCLVFSTLIQSWEKPSRFTAESALTLFGGEQNGPKRSLSPWAVWQKKSSPQNQLTI